MSDQVTPNKIIKIERCVYCNSFIENDNVLKCQECNGIVHIKCLPNGSTPGDLKGDIFFDLTCVECVKKNQNVVASSSQAAAVKEVLTRRRLPWLMILVLVFYNLEIKSKGLSYHGYFHWQNHVASFVEKNWIYLFQTQVRRRKRWIGTIAGVLSQFSPEFFISGAEELKRSGWWKLTYSNRTPKYIHMLYEQHCQKRQQERQEKRPATEELEIPVEVKKLRHSADSEEDIMLMGTCSRALPYMGREPKILKKQNSDADDSRTAVQSNLMDFLAETFSCDNDLTMFNSLPGETLDCVSGKNEFIPFLDPQEDNVHLFELPEMKVDKDDIANFSGTIESVHTADANNVDNNMDEIPLPRCGSASVQISHVVENYIENDTSGIDDDDDDDDNEDDDEYRPRIIQVTNFQNSLQSSATDLDNSNRTGDIVRQKIKTEVLSDVEHNETISEINMQEHDNIIEETTKPLPPCKPSLFNKQPRRLWPWLIEKNSEQFQNEAESSQSSQVRSLKQMSSYEESELLDKLRKIFSLESKQEIEIPTYIRRFYRKLCVREWKRSHNKPIFDIDNWGNNQMREQNESEWNILDRYQLVSTTDENSKKSFYARISGSPEYEFFESPYTKRVLHPFIYRNRECFPPWLKLLCEIQYKTTGVPPTRAPIDFCYVRPNHIAAVNALLQTLFWPGIDMSDCLSYPDYSVVAMYKQLIVGCGFLVPDVGYNEAYISFMGVRPGWQRSGIATFMLYHLIQTCLTKDITLHVSATNPAVMLYQKFGFKIEEMVLNFYDKYLPLDSKHSRHALFLRLAK